MYFLISVLILQVEHYSADKSPTTTKVSKNKPGYWFFYRQACDGTRFHPVTGDASLPKTPKSQVSNNSRTPLSGGRGRKPFRPDENSNPSTPTSSKRRGQSVVNYSESDADKNFIAELKNYNQSASKPTKSPASAIKRSSKQGSTKKAPATKSDAKLADPKPQSSKHVEMFLIEAIYR